MGKIKHIYDSANEEIFHSANFHSVKDDNGAELKAVIDDLQNRLIWAEIGNPPSWFKDSLVCYYDPYKQNLKNGIDIKGGETFLMKDFSPNHLDMSMYNFQGKGMSGMDGYPVDFTTGWAMIKSNSDFNSTDHELQITEILKSWVPFCYFTNKEIPSMKIKVSGVNSDVYVRYSYFADSVSKRKSIDLNENKIYVLPASALPNAEFTESDKQGGFFASEIQGKCNIKIEVLPDYKDALVFDGADDWGIREDFPIVNSTDGYTIIAKRKIIDKVEVQNLVSDGNAYATSNTGYRFELRNANDYNIISNFGATNQLTGEFAKDDFSYQTSRTYNGTPIIKGELTQSNPWMLLGKVSKTEAEFYWNGALYSLLLFNRDLTVDEIDWVKKNIMGYTEPAEIQL